MPHIEWSANYSTGIEIIDDQHKQIICLINDLHDAIEKKDRVQVGKVIDGLVAYTLSHFEFEERLLEGAEYEFLGAHKKLHDRFVERLAQYSQRFESGECIGMEMYQFLSEWLMHHISREDLDYCEKVVASMNGDHRKKGWFARTFG